MKGRVFERRRGGGGGRGGRGIILMRGLSTRPGLRGDSSTPIRMCISTGLLIHTLISYNICPPAVFRYTHSMVLHPRTAPNIPENQHLDRDLGLIDGT